MVQYVNQHVFCTVRRRSEVLRQLCSNFFATRLKIKRTEDFTATDMISSRPQTFVVIAEKVEQRCLSSLDIIHSISMQTLSSCSIPSKFKINTVKRQKKATYDEILAI